MFPIMFIIMAHLLVVMMAGSTITLFILRYFVLTIESEV